MGGWQLQPYSRLPLDNASCSCLGERYPFRHSHLQDLIGTKEQIFSTLPPKGNTLARAPTAQEAGLAAFMLLLPQLFQ